MVQQDPNRDEDDARSGANTIVLVVALVIIAIGCFVAWEMKKETNLENCFAASRRDCVPIDDSH